MNLHPRDLDRADRAVDGTIARGEPEADCLPQPAIEPGDARGARRAARPRRWRRAPGATGTITKRTRRAQGRAADRDPARRPRAHPARLAYTSCEPSPMPARRPRTATSSASRFGVDAAGLRRGRAVAAPGRRAPGPRRASAGVPSIVGSDDAARCRTLVLDEEGSRRIGDLDESAPRQARRHRFPRSTRTGSWKPGETRSSRVPIAARDPATASTRCSRVFGPAIDPSLVTWPTRMTAMSSPLARSISRSADSRTCPTLPAGPSSSSTVTVWIESTITRAGLVARAMSVIRPTSPSARTLMADPVAESVSPSRMARRRTCAALSSPVTYRTVRAGSVPRATPAAAWRSSVDLPTPGSPPSRTRDPGTSPPPRTRSSSAIPTGMRSAGGAPTSESGTATPPTAAGRDPAARSLRAPGRTTVSTRVFQPLQFLHWPSQRRNDSPQL